MNTSLKKVAKTVLKNLGVDLTKNMKYDRLTERIMKQVLKSDSNCIDIGCHKGEVMDFILGCAPAGSHYGFEPLPHLYDALKEKYSDRVSIMPYALADRHGEHSFQYVVNDPAYSGLKQRRYDRSDPIIEQIDVDVRCLDDVIPPDTTIDFIKIDVEGGEYDVLKGGRQLIKKHRPVILFESGKAASVSYGTNPEQFFDFVVDDLGLDIFLLQAFAKQGRPLMKQDFLRFYETGAEYYFLGSPK